MSQSRMSVSTKANTVPDSGSWMELSSSAHQSKTPVPVSLWLLLGEDWVVSMSSVDCSLTNFLTWCFCPVCLKTVQIYIFDQNKMLNFCSQNTARYYLQLLFVWTVKNIKSADSNRNTAQIEKPSNFEQPIRSLLISNNQSAFRAPALGVRACTLGDN